MSRRSSLRDGLDSLLTPLAVLSAGHAHYPTFASSSSKVAVGFFGLPFFFFVFLYLVVHNLAQACMLLVLFSYNLVSLYFVA